VSDLDAPRPNGQAPDGIYLADLHSVEMRDPEWLVRGYLPAGELTLLVGAGGTNKGTWAATLAAMVTRGKAESQNGEPAHVLWAAAEDNLGSVLKPRLVAAGANLDLVKPFGIRRSGVEDALCLPDDVPALRDAVDALAAKLVVVDPLLSHLSGKVDSYRDHDVKRSLRPLAQMANETGCAVLGLHHFNKDTSRGAVASSQASGAFSNTARIVLAMAEHDEDEMLRVLEVVKTNISKKGLRKALRVDLVIIPGLAEPVPRTVEAGDIDKTVDELLGGRPAKGAKRADARKLILRELTDGPKPLDHLKAKAASELGVSGETVWRAANALKGEDAILTRNSGPGTPWLWQLTEDALTSSTGSANPHEHQTSSYTTYEDVNDFGTNTDADFLTSSATVV
jgi:AAA domain